MVNCTGASAISQPTTHPLCSSGWAWDDHSCYLFGTDTRSWSDAQSYCEDLGADLVTIESDREFEFLVNYYRYRYSSRRFWIGLTYSTSDGKNIFFLIQEFSIIFVQHAITNRNIL